MGRVVATRRTGENAARDEVDAGGRNVSREWTFFMAAREVVVRVVD
jgi:hypothetical protein